MANKKQYEMELAFEKSNLRDQPDLALISDLAFRLRDKFYRDRK